MRSVYGSISLICIVWAFVYLAHTNFILLILCTQGFKKVSTDRYEFAHEFFLRGRKHLIKNIHRRKSAGLLVEHKQLEQEPILSVAENEMSGFKGAIEHLKDDHLSLVSEIVMLRQQQQTMEKEARALADRVQAVERRKEQITNFLARAICSPAFLAHLQLQSEVHQIGNEAKKRRCLLPSMNDIEDFMGVVCMQTSEDSKDFGNKNDAGELHKDKAVLKSSDISEMYLAQSLDMVSEVVPPYPNTLWEGLSAQLLEAVGNRDKFPVDDRAFNSKAEFLFPQLVDDANEMDLTFDLNDFTQELASAMESADLGTGLSLDFAQGNVSHKLQQTGESLKSSLTTEEKEHSVVSVEFETK
ncbi:hypothetical protein GOP47_0024155 [Adiantum capillus-veneris]|uniref:Uncharacterized protein n=1 Tax=Adiantum capillus-veneris TaxID=13818 RepID=A0A9D4U5V5_ADICA|nr:hypothetical protein GOP47_0024155 [Adiantum capillus-veneris]